MDLFMSFEGRIARKGFWLGLLGIMAISLLAGGTVLSVLPDGIVRIFAQIILSAGVVYIWSAVVVKRLHDRGKPALPWAVIFIAPGILMQAISIFQIGYSPVDFAGTQVLMPGLATTIAMWAATAVALWMVVELGFLKGTPGANAYGPNPLGKAAPAPAA
ncbi:DUF805 domain-containing protein [Pelagibacterium xiamenense]|uniref:DUF805 domain-containing protein n=1 Tax=Pelagibacterium xiamenense TaxID=2901140 RepID=UPI001E2E1247|nr:DUF805 domain-containing protein [Pelagibacterium xiamenense]MCD7058639.1 DUF805 domain-containing protein [Pelagibacterium xiamenense]